MFLEVHHVSSVTLRVKILENIESRVRGVPRYISGSPVVPDDLLDCLHPVLFSGSLKEREQCYEHYLSISDLYWDYTQDIPPHGM